MDIKRILLPEQIETDRRLYYRIDDELVTKEEDGSLTFLKGGTADFDTYFNSFSIGKWREYTVLGDGPAGAEASREALPSI